MAIVVATTMFVGFAYAERATIEVPFEVHGSSCWFDQESVIYNCTWQGSNETVTKQGLTDAGIVPPEQILEESKEAHEEAVEEKEKDTRTATERKIEELKHDEEIGRISSADKILLDLLTDLKDSCELGIEHGRLIQNYAEFELPVSDPRTAYKAIDYGTNPQLGKIIMKIEECKAWDKYRVEILGQRYLDIIVDDSTSQGYHADQAMTTETFPQTALTDQDFRDSEQKALDLICENSLYHNSYKKQMGCFEVEELPEGLGLPIRESEAYKNYLEYMSSGYVDIATLKKQEVDRYVGETMDSFAERFGINPDELKALVQNEQINEYNEDKKNP